MPVARWTVVLIAVVILRSAVFVLWPAAHFDSDQAITGLMAKHLSELRAFPVFWYGQTYMLGVEAWLAAPLMAVAGASVTALKLPLLAMNVAIVWLLMRGLTREAGLEPAPAAFATMFFVLPSPITTAHFLTANGGNVEPALYVLLLWTVRHRPLWVGLVLGIGFLNREFTIYGAIALVILDAAGRRLFTTGALARYAAAFGTAGLVWLSFQLLRQVSSAAGPGTSVADLHSQLAGNNLLQVAERLCLDAGAIVSGIGRIVTSHWPELFGLEPQPLTDFGIESGVGQGVAGGGWLLVPVLGVPLLTLAALGARSANRRSAGARSADNPSAGARSADGPVPGVRSVGARSADGRSESPDPDASISRSCTDAPVSRSGTGLAGFPAYLMVVAMLSVIGYLAGRCGAVDFYTMRYELLSVLGAVGLSARCLQIPGGRAVRAFWAAGCAAIFALAAASHTRLLAEYVTGPPVGRKQALVRVLEARGTRYGYADYWTAYYVTFLTQERTVVTATEIPRIKLYEKLVNGHRAEAILISRRPCPGAQPLTDAFWSCAPANP